MDGKALAKTSSAVTPWALRQDVREMEERLKTMLPGAQKLNTMELFGLAQAAIAHNLDPFNGELWCIPGKGLMAGIKGHRRAAHRQINEEAGGNGNYYVEFSQLTVDEMTALKIPPKSLGFRARLHDSQTTRAYVENVERMLKAGMPWETVARIMGDQPYTEGVGYYVDGEPTKMTPVQCSQKRAEADALKRRFDLPFTMAIGANGDADVIDAEFSIGQSQPEQDPAEVQARMQVGSNALRGDQGDLGPDWANEQYPPNAAQAKTMTDRPAAPDPEPPAQPEPAQPAPAAKSTNGKAKQAKVAVALTIPFHDWCTEWIKDARAAQYRIEGHDNMPNMYHILGRVAKEGYTEVIGENVEAVKAALQKHVEQE